MRNRLPGWLYWPLYYATPIAIALMVIAAIMWGTAIALRHVQESVPPRPRIEVLATDDVRCVVVHGEAVTCQWLEVGHD